MAAQMVQQPISWTIPLALLLLLRFLLLSVAANEPIDSMCRSSSEYLAAMYDCRPSDFQVMSFCAASPPYELTCNRTKRIAVLTASLGPSLNNQCNQPQTIPFVGSTGHTGRSEGGECCLLPAVETKCRGKGKCSLNSDVVHQQTVDARLCSTPTSSSSSSSSSSSRRQQRATPLISVVFICVSPKTLKDINRDKSSPDAFCEGQTDPPPLDDIVPPPATDNQLLHEPADIFKPNGHLTTTGAIQRLESTNSAAGLTSSGVGESSSSDVVSPVMHRRVGTVDWIWSFIYIKDNMDRFLIYLFLSVAIGVICVLLVVILGLCFGDRFRHRKRSSASSPSSSDVIHRKQSSTQTTTNDVTSALIATNRSPGIEMVRYVPTNSSLRSQQQPVMMRTALPSLATQATPAAASVSAPGGNMVHFAPADGSSTDDLDGGSTDSYTGNGGYPPRGGGVGGGVVHGGLNLPQYQLNNTSVDSVDDGGVGGAGEPGGEGAMERGRGGGGGDGSDDYRSSTLGRFYSNPYRHDSYRSDGYRTLQHK